MQLPSGKLPAYDPMLDLARLALEFGYVMMFTVVWPLAPLACLLISALEQRAAAVRLTVACQRPSTGLRCNGLGTGDAWFDIFVFLAWLSIPINVGMIALATQQLDIYFETPLPPFEKLLCAVLAEHALLALKLLVQFMCDGGADEDGSEAAEAQRRKYLRSTYGLGTEGLDAEGGALTPRASSHASTDFGGSAAPHEPRLTSVFPSSGPAAAGTAVTIRGERLGLAISRGEITLRVHLPRAARTVSRSRAADVPPTMTTLTATFVSDRKLTCVLPPCEGAGVAVIQVVRTDADNKPSMPPPKGVVAPKPSDAGAKPSTLSPTRQDPKLAAHGALADATATPSGRVAASDGGGGGLSDPSGGGAAGASIGGGVIGVALGTPNPATSGGLPAVHATPSRDQLPEVADGACSFRYYAPFVAQRLRPSCGPIVGGTPVRVLGSGFVDTGEITCCVRMAGVERRIPATFVSESEVRFLTPSFIETGDAKVALALNGHDYDLSSEALCFQYQAAPLNCSVQ